MPRILPAIGGVEQHVRNISERLDREHQVTVFATDPSGELPKEEEINGVLVRRFKSFSPNNAYHISPDAAGAVDNENCFGIDYPVDNEELAQLINKVIGQKVGDVKLWDWDQVAKETDRVYKE
jgi:hypothetical protein